MLNVFWSFQPEGEAGPHTQADVDIERRRADRAEREAGYIDERVDRLTLICMAMWSLLQEKTGLTEEDLLDRVKQIDLMDGQEDGKFKKQIAQCPKCKRVMSARHGRCLYCGAADLHYTAFDTVR